MPGWNPWMVLCVPEDASYPEVQRSFRRMVKTTHPDGGGDARSFDAVVRAFADIRRRHPSEPAPRPLRLAASTPYDSWLRPAPPASSWSDDGGRKDDGVTVTSPGSDFSAVLLDEMAKVRDLVNV